MSQMNHTGFLGQIGNLAGYYRDIEVAKASGAGQSATNVRPESIPDQTSVGRSDEHGPPTSGRATVNRISLAGIEMDTRVLTTTGLVIGGLLAIRALK